MRAFGRLRINAPWSRIGEHQPRHDVLVKIYAWLSSDERSKLTQKALQKQLALEKSLPTAADAWGQVEITAKNQDCLMEANLEKYRTH